MTLNNVQAAAQSHMACAECSNPQLSTMSAMLDQLDSSMQQHDIAIDIYAS
jgi:hypothetical protein